MRIKLSFLFLGLMLIFIKSADCSGLSQARSLFYQGNTHYSEEKFQQAIVDYEKALSLGYESGPVYYNLGNAYFKQGKLGKAILNYLRAQRLMPRDADLKSNLDYVRSLIKGGVVAPKENWLTRIFFRLVDSFSLDTITLLSSILYFILSALVIFFILVKNLRKMLAYISALTLVLLLICLGSFFGQFYKTVIRKEAVIIAETSETKFEPFDDATTFFTLNEGESVLVVTSKKDWVKVARIDGKQGWVKKKDIQFL
jgi:tetratricopeptide (TPR) repeat protein